jgi:hypothetical protein
VVSRLLQSPVVVDLTTQPEPTHDISLDVVLSIFALAGMFLLAAAFGSAVVAGLVVLYKKRREGSVPAAGTTHTRLGL